MNKKTKINKNIVTVMYLGLVAIHFIFMICSLVYNTRDGVGFMSGMTAFGTFAFIFLIRLANEQEEKERKEKEQNH